MNSFYLHLRYVKNSQFLKDAHYSQIFFLKPQVHISILLESLSFLFILEVRIYDHLYITT